MSERVAIVTGTSAGIGQALAELLLTREWTVVGVSRRAVTFDQPGYRHLSHDLADVANLESALGPGLLHELAAGTFGRVGLVNNGAAMGQLRPIERWEPAEQLRVYATNVVAPTWLMGWLGRTVPADRSLRIVNVSSGASGLPIPGLGDYGSSKAALRHVGATFAAEHEGRDLAVLSYEPGVVETAMQETARAQSPADFPSQPLFIEFARSGRSATPAQVVPTIADFLENAEARGFSEARFGE
jgi:benzil reductase ((S)-benzoin forming)